MLAPQKSTRSRINCLSSQSAAHLACRFRTYGSLSWDFNHIHCGPGELLRLRDRISSTNKPFWTPSNHYWLLHTSKKWAGRSVDFGPVKQASILGKINTVLVTPALTESKDVSWARISTKPWRTFCQDGTWLCSRHIQRTQKFILYGCHSYNIGKKNTYHILVFNFKAAPF